MTAFSETSPALWPRRMRGLLLFCLPLALFYLPFLINEFELPREMLSAADRSRYDIMGGDFINIWAAARLTLEGRVMELFDLDGFNAAQKSLIGHDLAFYNWGYPPFFIAWIAGLGLLPYGAAFIAWVEMTFAAFAAAVTAGKPKPYTLALLLALAPASFLNLCDGQNGFLSAALLVGGLRLLERRPVLAGICFGLLIFKPHLGLMVPVALIAARQGKVFSVAAITVFLLVAFSFLLFGVEPWRSYFSVVAPYQRELLETSLQDLWALKWPTAFMAARNLGASVGTAYGVSLGAALGAAAAVFYAFKFQHDVARRNVVLLTAAMLASPYLNNYDLTIVSAGIVLLITDARQLSPLLTGMMGLIWLLPLFVTTFNAMRLPLSPLLLAGFLAVQIFELRKVQGGVSSTPK